MRWLVSHLAPLLLEAPPRVARTVERLEEVGELIKDALDHQAVDAIEGWDAALSNEVVHTAELVISEFVTNAVRHSENGPVSLSVRLGEQSLRIEVCDDCTELPRPGFPDPCSESGRGLFLVAALADRYGVEPTAIGKCCWAEITLPTTTNQPIVSPSPHSGAPFAGRTARPGRAAGGAATRGPCPPVGRRQEPAARLAPDLPRGRTATTALPAAVVPRTTGVWSGPEPGAPRGAGGVFGPRSLPVAAGGAAGTCTVIVRPVGPPGGNARPAGVSGGWKALVVNRLRATSVLVVRNGGTPAARVPLVLRRHPP
ncbi:ATP-binding protein [Streptomyces ziwulingensis]